MNSIGKVLKGFEWDYVGTISTIKGTGYQGKGISRTLFLSPKNIEDIPEQLFAVKISQSANPAKTGQVVFRYFSYRFDENGKFENLAPTGITINTELSVVKATVIEKFKALAANPENPLIATVSINVNLHGKFTNIACTDGVYAIYDEDKFPNADPAKVGDAPYYIKSDTIVKVHLKGAESQGNEYLQSTLSVDATADEIFQKAAAGKIWGEDTAGIGGAAVAPAAPAPAAPQAPADGANSIW